jgi:hypothetical protein
MRSELERERRGRLGVTFHESLTSEPVDLRVLVVVSGVHADVVDV